MNISYFPMTFFLTIYFLSNSYKVPLCLFISLFFDAILYPFTYYHLLIMLVLLFLSFYFEKKKVSRFLQIFLYTSIYYLIFSIIFNKNVLLFYFLNLFYNLLGTFIFFKREKINI